MLSAGGGSDAGGHAATTYRGLRSRARPSPLGDINVTPLVDVVLVLLLVFMVTAPMMNRTVDVSLPVANPPQIKEETLRLTVSIDAEGMTYINDKPINFVLLEQEIRGRMQGQTQKVVYLRADEKLRYGKVIEVVDKLKKAGVDQIGFAYVLPQEKGAR
jgi:biopolymer transport protein ExbD